MKHLENSASQAQRPPGVEGRTQKRHSCRYKQIVRFAVRPTFQNFQALVHDVSVSGLGFLLDKPLEPGTVLAVQLQGGRHGTSMVRTAKVVHIRRHLPVEDAPWVKKKPFLKALLSFLGGEEKPSEEKFIYLIGCRMSVPLSPEEIESLCGPSGD